jgi:hypothetical protein
VIDKPEKEPTQEEIDAEMGADEYRREKEL